jgi:hypothetical protein
MDKSKPYGSRTDLEKLQTQWNKISGMQHRNKEWSAIIVRAATAAELAANFAIRREFETHSQFDSKGVDKLLYFANGLGGKMDKLLLPLTIGTASHNTINALNKIAQAINKERNAIVHQGEFRNEEEVPAVVEKAKTFVESLVRLYENDFSLKTINYKS